MTTMTTTTTMTTMTTVTTMTTITKMTTETAIQIQIESYNNYNEYRHSDLDSGLDSICNSCDVSFKQKCKNIPLPPPDSSCFA